MQNQKRDIKVLISADPHGRFEQLFPKITQIQAKNSFDFMIMIGEVCHPRASSFINKLKVSQISLPLPVYFIDNSQLAPILCNIYPNGAEIVHNFHFLGTKGVAQIKGLNIGFYNTNTDWKRGEPKSENIEQFLQMCQNKQIDILLTNEWSKQIQKISQKQNAKSAQYVTRLANSLNPRYHLAAGSDSFYRLPAYCNQKGQQTHFISVAPCGQQLKDKYLFALVVKSNNVQLAQPRSNFLNNPYEKLTNSENPPQLSIKQRVAQLAQKKQEPQGEIIVFFEGFPEWARKQDILEFLQRWGEINHFESFKDKKGGVSGTIRLSDYKATQNCLTDSGKYLFHSNRIKFQRRTVRQRQRVAECWFCKANSDKSLVAWWGRFLYISLEKGPLNRFHVQLIPYNHTQSTGRLDREQKEELEKVISTLKRHFTDKGYQILTYQRCLPLNQAVNHCLIHFIPLKSGLSLSKKFQTINKEDSLYFKQWKGDRRKNQYYLQLQINEKIYIREVQRKEKVQADIMRQILCQIFQTPKLVSWKACQRTSQQLTEQLTAFQREIQDAGLPVQKQQ